LSFAFPQQQRLRAQIRRSQNTLQIIGQALQESYVQKNTQNVQETAWVGAECQIMLGKIVGSEKKVVVPKLQKPEVFGQ